MSTGYKTNIENKTLNNNNYRKVLYTTPQMQLVVMSIEDDIPREKHKTTTQFVRVESGTGTITIGKKTYRVKDGDSVVIPPNTWHYVKQTGNKPLKIYSLYSPPEHPKNTVTRNQPYEYDN